jgi:hypothetical protein
MPSNADECSLGDLFAELSRETGILIRKEVELATTEMSGKLKVAGTQAGIRRRRRRPRTRGPARAARRDCDWAHLARDASMAGRPDRRGCGHCRRIRAGQPRLVKNAQHQLRAGANNGNAQGERDMDDENTGLNEGWGNPAAPRERAYAAQDQPPERRTEEIRSDIEQTRAELSETVDAIQDRLRPANLVSQARDTVREATVGKVKQMAENARSSLRSGGYGSDYGDYTDGDSVIDRIRANPIPAALAVASVAWIAFKGKDRSHRRTSPAIYGSTRDGEAFVRETVISEDVEDGWVSSRHGTTPPRWRAACRIVCAARRPRAQRNRWHARRPSARRQRQPDRGRCDCRGGRTHHRPGAAGNGARE